MSQSVTFTSLSLQDGISYNQDLLMHVGHVNDGPSCVVATPTTSLDCCCCLKEKDIMKLPNMDKYGK